MASYELKYYAEFRNFRNQDYRLEILQRYWDGNDKKIGYLSGCVLEVQGNMGTIIAPIVKTQLRFTIVDASDVADTNSTKYGNWQEFYTPDATLYKVVLKCWVGNAWVTEWSGYITPDSWQESLDYRGGITITARDNIGHLKDFPFSTDGWNDVDENGLVEIENIIYRAVSIIDFPMTFYLESHGPGQYSADVPCTENDDYPLDASVNADLFDGMNWYDVLEQTLEAIGYAFRFVGGNECVVCCLRNLPKLGHYTDAVGSQALEFYGGTMELDPAVKKIEEDQDYKMSRELDLEIFEGLQFGEASTYKCQTSGNTLPSGGSSSIPEHDAPDNSVSAEGRTPWVENTLLFDPSGKLPDDFLKRSEGEDGWKNYIFIPGNHVYDNVPHTNFRFLSRTGNIRLTFNLTPHPLAIRMSGSMTGKMMDPSYSLARIKYAVNFVNDDSSVVRYWNGGSWKSTDGPFILTKEYDSQNGFDTTFDIDLAECEDIDVGRIVVFFYDIQYKMWSEGGHGCYARVSTVKAELLGTKVLQSNKVTTINNDAYNVLLSRRPLFGALSKEMGFVLPQNYLAGMFLYPYIGSHPQVFPYMVRFTDQNDSMLVPLPVLIHEQILCYYYGAARVLQGSCAPPENALFRFNKLNTYKGHRYLFQGGTMDYFSGTINNATFREFLDYEDLWDESAPTYEEKIEYR